MLISVWDESLPGRRVQAEPLALDRTSATVRDLIRIRIQQEAERYDRSAPDVFQGLVQPEDSEQILNGFRMKTRRRLDPEAQFQRACRSFETNGFLLLVDGQQVTDLEARVELHGRSEVQFIKLAPLIGG